MFTIHLDENNWRDTITLGSIIQQDGSWGRLQTYNYWACANIIRNCGESLIDFLSPSIDDHYHILQYYCQYNVNDNIETPHILNFFITMFEQNVNLFNCELPIIETIVRKHSVNALLTALNTIYSQNISWFQLIASLYQQAFIDRAVPIITDFITNEHDYSSYPSLSLGMGSFTLARNLLEKSLESNKELYITAVCNMSPARFSSKSSWLNDWLPDVIGARQLLEI